MPAPKDLGPTFTVTAAVCVYLSGGIQLMNGRKVPCGCGRTHYISKKEDADRVKEGGEYTALGRKSKTGAKIEMRPRITIWKNFRLSSKLN
jgi:hypothetical protein